MEDLQLQIILFTSEDEKAVNNVLMFIHVTCVILMLPVLF